MRIDIHHHFLHKDHMAEEAQRLSMAHGLSREKLLSWTPEIALETMDRNKIDVGHRFDFDARRLVRRHCRSATAGPALE